MYLYALWGSVVLMYNISLPLPPVLTEQNTIHSQKKRYQIVLKWIVCAQMDFDSEALCQLSQSDELMDILFIYLCPVWK